MVDEAGVARPCESGSGVTGTAFDREQEQIATSSPVIAIPCRTAALGKLADLDHPRDVASQARGLTVLLVHD